MFLTGKLAEKLIDKMSKHDVKGYQFPGLLSLVFLEHLVRTDSEKFSDTLEHIYKNTGNNKETKDLHNFARELCSMIILETTE